MAKASKLMKGRPANNLTRQTSGNSSPKGVFPGIKKSTATKTKGKKGY